MRDKALAREAPRDYTVGMKARGLHIGQPGGWRAAVLAAVLSLSGCAADRPPPMKLCGTSWPPAKIALQSHRYAGVTYVAYLLCVPQPIPADLVVTAIEVADEYALKAQPGLRPTPQPGAIAPARGTDDERIRTAKAMAATYIRVLGISRQERGKPRELTIEYVDPERLPEWRTSHVTCGGFPDCFSIEVDLETMKAHGHLSYEM